MSSWSGFQDPRSRELAAVGPIIDVSIIGRAANAPPVSARALIDTGSSVVFIDRRIALKAGLKAVDVQDVHVPGGLKVEATVYLGTLAAPALGFRERVRLFAATHRQVSHEVLLGRDFLSRFIMIYNGPEGLFYFFDPPRTNAMEDDFAT